MRLLLPGLILAACTLQPDGRGNTADASRDAAAAVAARVESGALGVIGDVAAGADGMLYVLDVGQKQLAVIPRAGGPRQVLGRVGHGPGELADPVALALTGAGRLYLLDRGNQRLEVYGALHGRLERAASLRLDFVPEDVCSLGERLFVLGPRGGYLLHEVSPRDGRVLRSLVFDPASRDPMLSAFHGSGLVQCGPGDDLTVLPLLRPEIARYSAASGRRLGTIRIPRYRETRVRRAGAGVIYQASPGGDADYAGSLVRLPDGRMLVQVGPVRRGATRYEFTSLRSFVLSWGENMLTELAPTLPRIGDIRGDTAVAVHTDPVPALTRLALRLPAAPGGRRVDGVPVPSGPPGAGHSGEQETP